MRPGWDDLPRMEREAFDLSRLQLKVKTSPAHPDGACDREHMTCHGCRMPARVATRFGGPMADCRACCFAWAVEHDPVRCWQNLTPLGSFGQGVLR
ncbi:hypothetical protein [Streptomyces sp. NBC_01408]|uniref:hypothetical protein n=1 Tax=Streptomyces sp. NBC_01408 TaxID=2903855 RepID=UPI0022558371|nr:hypothetical protein [Streptomyces sp. NBC_01408]MCX4696888.1 hypothetical protein [Streptomyces sp. NBC_01408]